MVKKFISLLAVVLGFSFGSAQAADRSFYVEGGTNLDFHLMSYTVDMSQYQCR